MKIKTSELQGAALDWAVAKCEGKLITMLCGVMVRNNDGMLSPTKSNPLIKWKPSTDWSQGGPIIERERINLIVSDGHWFAETWATNSGETVNMNSPTPLIAAMRCYVASKLGDEVDVPDSLIG